MKRTENTIVSNPDEAMRAFRRNNDIGLLSRKTGCSHNGLLDRLNPDRDQKLGYLEAIGHSHLTGDNGLLKAWASELGYGLFKKPTGTVGDEEILDTFLSIQMIQGRFARVLHEAREDGVINPKENAALSAIIDDTMNSLATLKAEIGSQVREM